MDDLKKEYNEKEEQIKSETDALIEDLKRQVDEALKKHSLNQL